MKTSYYKIDDETVTGSIAILDIFPEAETMSSADFLAHGYVQFSIPDDVLTIFPRYKDGRLTIDPPPYWDELREGISGLKISREVLTDTHLNPVFSGVFALFLIAIQNKDCIAMSMALSGITKLLTNDNTQTSAELVELTDLLLDCDFTSEILTSAIPESIYAKANSLETSRIIQSQKYLTEIIQSLDSILS